MNMVIVWDERFQNDLFLSNGIFNRDSFSKAWKDSSAHLVFRILLTGV